MLYMQLRVAGSFMSSCALSACRYPSAGTKAYFLRLGDLCQAKGAPSAQCPQHGGAQLCQKGNIARRLEPASDTVLFSSVRVSSLP